MAVGTDPLAGDPETQGVELVLDAEPILSPTLLGLAQWAADYYQVPLGEALRCALPPATELHETRRLHITSAGREHLPAQAEMFSPGAAANARGRKARDTGQRGENARGKHGDGARRMAALLRAADAAAARGGLALAGALRRFGAGGVRRALGQGWLRLEVAARADESGAAEPIQAWRLVAAAAASGDASRPAPRRAEAVARLRAAGGEMDEAELRRFVSPAVLRALAAKGWIEACPRPAPPPSPLWHPRPRVERLNEEQSAALAAITARLPEAAALGQGEAGGEGGGESAGAAHPPRPLLLHGVTGSGKTAVYLEAIAAALARGGEALLLVPEIGLTPALFADFADAFPDRVAVLHSGLGPAERARYWHRARRGEIGVLIGTRSAVWTPRPRLALIIVDEEHDAAYKQQESPRYHARDLAVLRGRREGAAVVLGSATPSLESWENARAGKYDLARLTRRVERRPPPAMRAVDMRAEFRRRAPAAPAAGSARRREGASPGLERSEGGEELSAPLLAAIEDRLTRGEQAMILINRRGFAPVVSCRACGLAVSCRDCDLAMTYHLRGHRLLCHVCGHAAAPPEVCPDCGSEHLYYFGVGSEKIEAALAGLFPRARIARLDRDSARGRKDFARVLAAFRAGEFDLLVGTQMIAKGHDLPKVTLVGVIRADAGLAVPEFRAAERVYQLLTQVAGRAGRGQIPGEVILQLEHPDHYAVQAALNADSSLFLDAEARYRRLLFYPPFAALALVRVRHRDHDRVLAWSAELGRFLEAQLASHPGIRLLGPAPAPVARVKAEHRFQFLLKSAGRGELSQVLRALRRFAADRLPAAALVLDVDPDQLN